MIKVNVSMISTLVIINSALVMIMIMIQVIIIMLLATLGTLPLKRMVIKKNPLGKSIRQGAFKKRNNPLLYHRTQTKTRAKNRFPKEASRNGTR